MVVKKIAKSAIKLLEVIVHPGTTDNEVLAAVHAYQRKLQCIAGHYVTVEDLGIAAYGRSTDGRDLPEWEEQWAAEFAEKSEEIIKLQKSIDRLKAKESEEIIKLQKRIDRLKAKEDELTETIDELKEERDSALQRCREMKRSNGHHPQWVSGAKPDMIGKNGKVKRKESTPWSEQDRAYLAMLYNEDPSRRNLYLAERCTACFGRMITENAIRGMLNTLRIEQRISKYRPGRERHRPGA